MPLSVSLPVSEAYLARLPLLKIALKTTGVLDSLLQPVWDLLRAGEYRQVRALAGRSLANPDLTGAMQAALLAAAGLAELRLGHISAARQLAERSLQAHDEQVLARLIQFEVRVAEQDYRAAHALMTAVIARLDEARTPAEWDEQVPIRERHLTAASLAWRLQDWGNVAAQVHEAFPEGLDRMPEWLLEDYFRLALYRNLRLDAAAAAALLIRKRTAESADALLQTLVQQGWTEQALPLYRTAYSEAPRSALLRRRLVALCLREGAVEEARTLARPAALEIARASKRTVPQPARNR